MIGILLTLCIGSNCSEHIIDSFQYDPTQQLLSWSEKGVPHIQFGIAVFRYDGDTIDARTDWMFANGLD